MSRYKRNTDKMRLYKRAIGRCCDPDCQSNMCLEVHHIVPMSYSGLDCFQNYIVLCKDCHNGNRNHVDYDLRMELLLTWKFMAEILEIGLTSDDHSPEAYRAALWGHIKANHL